MNAIKEFLKPNRWKVGIFILLSFFFSSHDYYYHPGQINYEGCTNYYGFPFSYYCGGGLGFGTLNPQVFVLNLIIGYVLACLIYFIFSKIKRLISEPK